MKSVHILILSFLFSCRPTPELQKQKREYTADWKSLKEYEVPTWYKDTKFGIYFHWGPYSVPAHKTEWYSILMYNKDHPVHAYHKKTYGNNFGYKDFIPQFTGENFDAEEWADLFVQAGAQFAGPVAEHADGFAMWDSDLTKWDAMDMGPKKDIVGEMAKAIKKRGLKFVTTYHRHWLYSWYPTWDTSTDAGDPKYAGLYGPYAPEGSFTLATGDYPSRPDSIFQLDWLARLNELMDKYEPDIIWFDNKMDIIDERYRLEFLKGFYNRAQNWNKEVVCTYKFNDMKEGTAILDLERSRMSDLKSFVWLTDDSIDWEAWCHISNPKYKSTNRLIDFLVDVVSKNGAVLLNITPKADGTIPEPVKNRLLEMGKWLSINGEAIYGSRPWKIFGEGPQTITEGHLSEEKNDGATVEDIRFTFKNNCLYVIILDIPEEEIMITSLAQKKGLLTVAIQTVSILGTNQKPDWDLTEAGLKLSIPATFNGDFAMVYKLEF